MPSATDQRDQTLPRQTAERFFCPCPRGLEQALAVELSELGIVADEIVPGGLGFSGQWTACYRVNLWSRIASRVLWRVGESRYRTEDDVYRAAVALPWPSWFSVGDLIRVNVSAISSPVHSLEFITLRVKDAVCDKFRNETGRRPSVDTSQPDVRIHAFLTDRDVTFYLDTSGDALFKRGSRREVTTAPLRENLAAGILRLIAWQPEEPLLDPMCGGGTFLSEAAQMALGVAAGRDRKFAFERLSSFNASLWSSMVEEARLQVGNNAKPRIFGSDVDPQAIEATRINLQAAGVLEHVQLELSDVTQRAAPAESGVLVTNPPYGLRLGNQHSLQDFYPRLGDALKHRFSDWRAYFLSADMDLPKLIRLKASKRTPLFNGPLECRLFEYRMVVGSLRRQSRQGEITILPQE